MTITKKIALPVATATAALAIGGALLVYSNASPNQKSTTPQPATSQITQPTTTTESQPVQETASTAPQTATAEPTTSTTPTTTTTQAPTPVSDLAKPYAISMGEDDYQAGCFVGILGYRTDWNITETQMHDKYASIKATYPSMCAAYSIAIKNPKDANLRGM